MIKISQAQKKILVQLVREVESKPIPKNTFLLLLEKGLVTQDYTLTRKGFLKATEFVSLDEQCKLLELPLKKLKVDSFQQPEITALNFLLNQEFVGTYCEGGSILIVLKALALDTLASLNTFNSREDACTRFLEAQLQILKEYKSIILNQIHRTDVHSFIKNFAEIISYSSIQEAYPSLTIDFAKKFISALDRKVLVSIADKFFEDPYQYRKGWPDLTLTNGKQIQFIEVKTTDKLHISQIVILNEFRALIPYEFSVLKLMKTK